MKASPAETALVGARNARVTLDAGFTSVRDVGTYRGLTDVALRNAIERGDVPGPRMWVAGAYITIPKGGGELNGVVPNEQLPPDMRLGVAATPEEARSEEHTSELQSLMRNSYAVFCLKKKTNKHLQKTDTRE